MVKGSCQRISSSSFSSWRSKGLRSLHGPTAGVVGGWCFVGSNDPAAAPAPLLAYVSKEIQGDFLDCNLS